MEPFSKKVLRIVFGVLIFVCCLFNLVKFIVPSLRGQKLTSL